MSISNAILYQIRLENLQGHVIVVFFGSSCKIWDIFSRFRERVVIFRTMLQDFGKSYMSWQELLVEATLLYANNQA